MVSVKIAFAREALTREAEATAQQQQARQTSTATEAAITVARSGKERRTPVIQKTRTSGTGEMALLIN